MNCPALQVLSDLVAVPLLAETDEPGEGVIFEGLALTLDGVDLLRLIVGTKGLTILLRDVLGVAGVQVGYFQTYGSPDQLVLGLEVGELVQGDWLGDGCIDPP